MAPYTGQGHILLQYEPRLSINKDLDKGTSYDYLHMHDMAFVKNNKIIELNAEHH